MSVECTAESLAAASKCLSLSLSRAELLAARVVLLCAKINGTTMECTAQSLAAASKCLLESMSIPDLEAAETYLLCQIVNGGSSSAPDSINYAGPPILNPPSLQNIVVDSNGAVWLYYGSAWHLEAVGFNPTTRTKIFGGSTQWQFDGSGDYVYTNTGATLVEIEYSFYLDLGGGNEVAIAFTGIADSVHVTNNSAVVGLNTVLSSFLLLPGDSVTFSSSSGTGNRIAALWEIK